MKISRLALCVLLFLIFSFSYSEAGFGNNGSDNKSTELVTVQESKWSKKSDTREIGIGNIASGKRSTDSWTKYESKWTKKNETKEAEIAKSAEITVKSGKGVFVTYNEPKNKDYAQVAEIMKESKIFEIFADHINATFQLPEKLTLSLEEIGEENAYYVPAEKKIIVSYELLDYFDAMTNNNKDLSEEEKISLFFDLALFVTLHEFGHAMIDLCDIPMTGKEEDVADQLAFWMIVETTGETDFDSISSVLNAACWFAADFTGEDKSVTGVEFADSHSLDPQRFYNIISWAYGFNPAETEKAIDKKISEVLPESRYEMSADEYAKINNSFLKLLEKHIIK